jgi:hypothetical protein
MSSAPIGLMVALRSPDPSVMLCVKAKESIPDQQHGAGTLQVLSPASVPFWGIWCKKAQNELDK